jgi:hypothetical protein
MPNGDWGCSYLIAEGDWQAAKGRPAMHPILAHQRQQKCAIDQDANDPKAESREIFGSPACLIPQAPKRDLFRYATLAVPAGDCESTDLCQCLGTALDRSVPARERYFTRTVKGTALLCCSNVRAFRTELAQLPRRAMRGSVGQRGRRCLGRLHSEIVRKS